MIQSSQLSSEYTLDRGMLVCWGQTRLSVLAIGSQQARRQIQTCPRDHLWKVFYRREEKFCMLKEKEIKVEDH